MSILDHIFLFAVLFAVFVGITRIRQRYISKYYWQITFIPIILYSLILGCRYGWGNDYLSYKVRFERPFSYENEDIGFRTLNLFIHEINGNFVIAFIIYSLLFILGAFIWIKSYRGNKYMLALFLPATLFLSTYTIRQSVATSFIFLAFFFLSKKEWMYMMLMLITTYLIHPGALIVFLLIFSFYLGIKRPLPYKITILLYIIASLFATLFIQPILSASSIIMPYITFENKFQGYITNSDYWFNAESWDKNYIQGTFTKTLSMAFHVSIIYLGYITLQLRKQSNITYLYNSIVIGFITSRLFFALEILRRTADTIISFYFIPVGYAFFIFFNHNHLLSTKEKYFCKTSIICIFAYLILFYGRFILLSPERIFFWNK